MHCKSVFWFLYIGNISLIEVKFLTKELMNSLYLVKQKFSTLHFNIQTQKFNTLQFKIQREGTQKILKDFDQTIHFTVSSLAILLDLHHRLENFSKPSYSATVASVFRIEISQREYIWL